MKENKLISVDGKNYTVVPYSTTGGLRLLTKLTAILGEPVIKVIKALPEGDLREVLSKNIKEINLDEVANGVAALFAKINEDQAETLIKEILQNTLYQNSDVVSIFETHFQGEYRHLFKVVFKTLEAQYGDFLGARAALGNRAAVKAANG